MEDDTSLEGNEEVTVVDVYDIASEIGKECEKIIDRHGAESMTSLMPRVINALELLETLATRNERENTLVAELQAKIVQLESDKSEKAECRRRFERELELIEEQWRTESKDLVGAVTRLQEENRRLAQKDLSPSHKHPSETSNQADRELLEKLRANVERQRDELRLKDKMIQEKNDDIELLHMQMDKLNLSGKELKRKHRSFQGQVKTLCDERADFLVKLQEQQREIASLRQRLGLAQKENEDLTKNTSSTTIESDDCARFTAEELKDLLNERNALKARLNDLEDELEQYRPKRDTTPVEEDAPVQGPLPYEPDDAPWKKCHESGIRKFFRKIFAESGGGGGFPRRSLSTLSKMALSTPNNDHVAI